MNLYKLLFTLFFATLIFNTLVAQTSKERITFHIEDFISKRDHLKTEFALNKKIPQDFELQSLVALSRYPELKKEKIEFKYATGAYTMAARPKFSSILYWGKRNRKYQVFINTKSRNGGLLLSEVPFNEQVGVMGHELAHILYYTKKSALRILLDGIAYTSRKKFRSKFEKDTDKVAINRGFGWQIYDFSTRVLNEKKIPEKYKSYKRKIYLSPESVLEYIKGEGVLLLPENNKPPSGF